MKKQIKNAACIEGKTAKEKNFKQQYNNTPRHLQGRINRWLAKIPRAYQQNFKTAITGRSRTAAIKAKCLDCCCWQRAEVSNCSIDTCSLWLYRPYRRPENLKNPQKSGTLEDNSQGTA